MPFDGDLFRLFLATFAGHCCRLLSIAADGNRRQWAAMAAMGVTMDGNGGNGSQWMGMDVNHPGPRILGPGSWSQDPGS